MGRIRDRKEITFTILEQENDSYLDDFSLQNCKSYFLTTPKQDNLKNYKVT